MTINSTPAIFATLSYGESLAAEIRASQKGWRAWVLIEPHLIDPNDTFPIALNSNLRITFAFRHVELSEWHLDEKWTMDMDYAIKERPIHDVELQLTTESELLEQLDRLNCDPKDLKVPHLAEYPWPPATNNGTLDAG